MPRRQQVDAEMDMPILECDEEGSLPTSQRIGGVDRSDQEITQDREQAAQPSRTREERMLDEAKKMYYAGFMLLCARAQCALVQ
eukprot:SAG31_NODE_18661_length_627_cov_1.223485_2_plen_84_part_00